jgi:hypothetical protein
MNVSQKIDKLIEESLGEHLKNNWGKYATGLGALGAGVAGMHEFGDGETGFDKVAEGAKNFYGNITHKSPLDNLHQYNSANHGLEAVNKAAGDGTLSAEQMRDPGMIKSVEGMSGEAHRAGTRLAAQGLAGAAGLGTLGLAGYGAKKLADKRR